ncbi:Peptide hydrolase [Mycena indigotica]|uniref:Peptide hydrolase n=1 Tax=Mycena indigotica TaxID=2126181 RepID=A0A8H6S327_9AGAR|nr:Peptide hydrolase [Mycena indigotica]KAF7291994.1 Peptide hydrolase [Mycena indigotica]
MSLLSPKWGLWRSLVALSPFLIISPLISLRNIRTLPEPQEALIDAKSGLPQISEALILSTAKHLSEDIGYRTVGTREHAVADAWMYDLAKEMSEDCNKLARESGRKLECEVWRQQGSGTHRFDMMGKRLYKTYQNLTNIVIRISDGTPQGKAHALLLNAHLDSTLPSPGAADDAISVGVMLECMRVLVNTPDWSPAHAVILLFNHAEESLQDASHLFSTQHEIAHTVRAVINLEAAGTTGKELLFQATSEEMVQAYSQVPRPFGTIFANDIFNSGVLLSDTDFRQFEEYLDVPGLDIAIVGNSYLYHMRKDLVENIQPGVAQHMGENTLALVKHLSANGSPIPNLSGSAHHNQKIHLVFLSVLEHFFMYRFSTAKVMYGILLVSVFLWTRPILGDKKWQAGARAVPTGLLGAIIVPNLVALFMSKILGKGMSWFAAEVFGVLGLYAPAALLGGLASQLLLPRSAVDEKSALASILLAQSLLAFIIQLFNVGSAAIFFIVAMPIFGALVVNDLVLSTTGEISLWFYGLGSFAPLLCGTLLTVPTLEVFVPLTGRMGPVPADHIVATLVSILGAISLPLTIPFAHRVGYQSLRKMVGILGAAVLLDIAIYAQKNVFDSMHQKRLFVIHLENITTSEHHLHIGTADGAPGFPQLVQDIASHFAGVQAEAVVMNDHNSDWDPLYPFSAFLSPYKLALPADTQADYVSPWSTTFTLSTENDVTDLVAGTRSFQLVVTHPGLIWTVVAFDAHVLKWNLDDNPPNELARHHVKEASFYGSERWTLNLVVRLQPDSSGEILFNFIGLQESAMWPGKKASFYETGPFYAPGTGSQGPAMRLFEKLDAWLDEEKGGAVDATLLGCVAGVATI